MMNMRRGIKPIDRGDVLGGYEEDEGQARHTFTRALRLQAGP